MGQLRPQLLKEGREGRDNSGRGEGAGPKRVTYAAARSLPCRRTHASAVRLGERTDRSPDALPASIPTAGTMRSEGRADGRTDGRQRCFVVAPTRGRPAAATSLLLLLLAASAAAEHCLL